MGYRTTPNYDQPLTIKDKISTSWWRFFSDTDTGVPPSSETVITPTGSPFTYSAKLKGNVIVTGGTVTGIAIARSGTFYSTGEITGQYNLCANDQLQVTYSSPPTMVLFPT